MDKIITGFKELVEEAGFSVCLRHEPEEWLLDFLVYSEHEDFNKTLIHAFAEKESNYWQVDCTAYVFSTIDKEGEAIYQSSGIGECLDIKDVPAQLFKEVSEVLALVREAVERGEIETSQKHSEAFRIESDCIGASCFGKDLTISINPEFMKLTAYPEEEILEAVFDSLKEMDMDDVEYAFKDQDVSECAEQISCRVRDSYSGYCVSPTACDCGGNNEWCNQCFGVGVYGNIDEDPLLVVVEERHQPKLKKLVSEEERSEHHSLNT